MDYIINYFIDNEEVSHEEWTNRLTEDIKKENEKYVYDFTSVYWSDVSNGKDVNANGHFYWRRIKTGYDSAKELFNDLMLEGHYDIILDALQEMTEEEIFNIVSKIKQVNVKDEKLFLDDEKDWY